MLGRSAGGERPDDLAQAGDVDVVFDEQDLGHVEDGFAGEHDLAPP
jgi:hypothetical protein